MGKMVISEQVRFALGKGRQGAYVKRDGRSYPVLTTVRVGTRVDKDINACGSYVSF